jgi:probable F420-dependent oxidoreductase
VTPAFSATLFPYARWGSPLAILDAAREVEAMGFSAVNLPEHIAMPVHSGSGDEVDVWYDTAVLASAISSVTRRLRIVLNAVVIPYRHPIDTAKRIATLDQISAGRVSVVAGVGWLRREFTALGIDYAARGAMTDEYLRAVKDAWTEPPADFKGRYVQFPAVYGEPRCVQRPHVPIWIGGSSGRRIPLLRAANIGDGWAPANAVDAAMVAADAAFLTAAREECGRGGSPFTIACSLQLGALDDTTTRSRNHVGKPSHPSSNPPGGRTHSPDQTREEIGRLVSAGVSHFSLLFGWSSPNEYLDRLAAFAADVMADYPADEEATSSTTRVREGR